MRLHCLSKRNPRHFSMLVNFLLESRHSLLFRPEELHELTGVSESAIQKILDQYHKHFDSEMMPDKTLYSPKTPKQLQTKSTKDYYSPLDYNSGYKPYSASKLFGSQTKEHNYVLSQPSSVTSLDNFQSGIP